MLATKVLIVSAHPEPKSFSAAMAHTTADVLKAGGAEVRHSDLYAMGFNPVASSDDFGARKNLDYLNYAIEQRFNTEQGAFAEDIARELEKLLWCDLLILNFPVWWCSVPAILKGWIDRVLVSGLCYGGRRFYDHGGMVGKRAMLAFSIGARAHMFADDGVHGAIDLMMRPLQQGTLAYIGFSVLPSFIAWHVPYLAPEARREILEDYAVYLRRLDDLTPLATPSLEGFDREFNRIAATELAQ